MVESDFLSVKFISNIFIMVFLMLKMVDTTLNLNNYNRKNVCGSQRNRINYRACTI